MRGKRLDQEQVRGCAMMVLHFFQFRLGCTLGHQGHSSDKLTVKQVHCGRVGVLCIESKKHMVLLTIDLFFGEGKK